MLRELLKKHIKSQAKYVEVGYGQVEPNHLSAQRNAQIYAQLPADPRIAVLEQGQFVKYDYAAGLVNFTGKGEWMLVYNEIKLYRDGQLDCEFAMLKDNYQARVYSPLDYEQAQEMYGPTRLLQGVRERWNPENKTFDAIDEIPVYGKDGKATDVVADYSVASKVHDYYEFDDINNPEIEEDYRKRLFMKIRDYKERMMPKGTTMVPRVLKTMPGDLFTTNMINEDVLKVGDLLTPGAMVENEDGTISGGILAKAGADNADMVWEVVKVYNMPDFQRGVKIMRIK